MPGKPEGVGDILAKLMKKPALTKALLQARIWEEWDSIAGKPLCEHGKPQRIKDGLLTVMVESAVWMNKYSYRKWDIIRRINLQAGKELVSDIFLKLATDEEVKPKAPRRRRTTN
jgi:predicted nucleic acid-binding Zn ribbon protein